MISREELELGSGKAVGVALNQVLYSFLRLNLAETTDSNTIY